jgi:sulfatase maturation enzyme AslB (radical SAM superfamily)
VLSWEIIDQVQPFLKELAAQKGISLFRYIATNGVMPAQRAQWLAESFDLVGLSCDGTPEIQAAQRPLGGAHPENSSILERTAQILKKAGKPVHARVTITADTVDQQPAICRYICEKLTPQEIHVEPVYQNPKSDTRLYLNSTHLERFLSAYFEAQTIAAGYGIDWKMSGSRLHEIHTAHCNIQRQVLNLVPGEAATACFKLVNANQARDADLAIGRFEPSSGIFVVNDRHIRSLHSRYTQPKACAECLIQHQCSHNCPNACPLLNQPADEAVGGDFLCKLLRQASTQQLIRLSGMLEVNVSHPVAGLTLSLS